MDLDDRSLMTKRSTLQMAQAHECLPLQIRTAWHDVAEVSFGRKKAYGSIVVCGLGGSLLGAQMVESVFRDRLKVPMTFVTDYTLPRAVSKSTLLIFTSFSGSTEEIIACAHEAKKRGIVPVVMASGGELGAMAERFSWPLYRFDPSELAPSPRFGLGFSFAGIAGILHQAGLFALKESEIEAMMQAMGEVIDTCAPDVATLDNPAKQVAQSLADHEVIVIGAEHLSGNALTLAGQLQENAKQVAYAYLLPELNHHLLESFSFPKESAKKTVVCFIKSGHYGERNRLRIELTADIFEKAGLTVVEYEANGDTRLEEVGEVLQFTTYVAWFVSILHGVKDGLPRVDALKKGLG